jgi:hypothetical protein
MVNEFASVPPAGNALIPMRCESCRLIASSPINTKSACKSVNAPEPYQRTKTCVPLDRAAVGNPISYNPFTSCLNPPDVYVPIVAVAFAIAVHDD